MRCRARHLPAVMSAMAAAVSLLGGCSADVPDVGGDGGQLEEDCSPYADLLVAYTPPGSTGTSSEGEEALGAPDEGAVELDPDGVLTVGFIGLGGVVDGEGDELVLHAGATGETLAAAYVGDDPEALRYAGDVDEETLSVDLGTARASVAVYLRLVGLAGTLAVDAVEAVQTECSNANGG